MKISKLFHSKCIDIKIFIIIEHVKCVHFMAWGLGTKTNNVAEIPSMFHGLKHLVIEGIKDIIILGDSPNAIRVHAQKKAPTNLHLSILYERTYHILGKMSHVHFFMF